MIEQASSTCDEEPGDDLAGRLRSIAQQFRAWQNSPNRPPARSERQRVYKVLRFVRWSWFGVRSPGWIKNHLDYAIAYILGRSDHRRHVERAREKDSEPSWLAPNRFEVPKGEHVRIPGLFVVELFPPSEYESLTKAVGKHRLYSSPLRMASVDHDLLTKDRAGTGWQWRNLGAFTRYGRIARTSPDGRETALPPEIDEVALSEVQIGEAVTAVVATFYLTTEASRNVSAVWYEDHRPELVHGRGQWPRPETAQFTAFRRTQQAREAAHANARGWLAKTFPGFFATNREPQPLVDLLLFTLREATLEKNPNRQQDDAYRALGLTEHSTIQTSPELPAMNLERVDPHSTGYVNSARTWALWGQRRAIIDQNEQSMSKYGDVDNWAIVSFASQGMQDYLLRLSISEMLSVYHARYSALRDTARTRHGRFRLRNLEQLRTDILVLSLNVSSIERDITAFNRRNYRYEYDAMFTRDTAPWQKRIDEELGYPVSDPVDTNREMASDQARLLEQLQADDEQYRNILSDAANLTSSIQSLKAASSARWVALASLGVSLIALLLSDKSAHPLLSSAVDWLSHHF